MTWGAILRELLTDPLAWAFALIVGTATGLAGYAYGHHAASVANEQQTAKLENIELKKVATVEHTATIEINKASETYVEAKISNAANAAVVSNQFNGLRVKPMCDNTPAVAPVSSGINAAGTAERDRTGEVDFAGIESEVIRLGHDYDNAAAKINSLQALVTIYQKACAAESP